MKKIILIAMCAVFAVAAKAQTSTDDLKYLQSMFGMEKKELIAERMKLSQAESAKFWTLYEEYELFRSEISEKRAANFQKYNENYARMTDAKADELLKSTFEINEEMNKLWQKTYKSMAKEISAVKAGQFIYLEMYFEALGREKVSEIIPSIGELKPVKK